MSFPDRLSSVCPFVCKLFTFLIFFFRTISPISIKLGTNHPWVKKIQVDLNEGPNPFQAGYNTEIHVAKIPVSYTHLTLPTICSV